MRKTGLAWEEVELNLLTLSFPKEFEADFKEEHFKKSLRHVRIGLLMSIFFSGVLEFWMPGLYPRQNISSGLSGMRYIAHLHWRSCFFHTANFSKNTCNSVSLRLWGSPD